MSEFEKQFPTSEDDDIEDFIDNMSTQHGWIAALKWVLTIDEWKSDLKSLVRQELKANE